MTTSPIFFTIGYGGRKPTKFIQLLKEHSIEIVADVRLRPDRASFGVYSRAKDPQAGIAGLLGQAGIDYIALFELGNIFLELPDWAVRYRQLLQQSGPLLCERLVKIPQRLCLLCAEKRVAECHRLILADYLVQTTGWQVQHIE
jgi:uncharacterized protein (DUF488 family)